MGLGDSFCRAVTALMAVALMVLVALVFVNVVLRYGFNSSIKVSEEVSRWLFVWITFMGAVVAIREHTHLGTDALVSQYRQLLGDGRLIERQRVLQLLNRTAVAHEGFEQSDARRVRQRAKELRLEGGELPDSGWFARSASARR